MGVKNGYITGRVEGGQKMEKCLTVGLSLPPSNQNHSFKKYPLKMIQCVRSKTDRIIPPKRWNSSTLFSSHEKQLCSEDLFKDEVLIFPEGKMECCQNAYKSIKLRNSDLWGKVQAYHAQFITSSRWGAKT